MKWPVCDVSGTKWRKKVESLDLISSNLFLLKLKSNSEKKEYHRNSCCCKKGNSHEKSGYIFQEPDWEEQKDWKERTSEAVVGSDVSINCLVSFRSFGFSFSWTGSKVMTHESSSNHHLPTGRRCQKQCHYLNHCRCLCCDIESGDDLTVSQSRMMRTMMMMM